MGSRLRYSSAYADVEEALSRRPAVAAAPTCRLARWTGARSVIEAIEAQRYYLAANSTACHYSSISGAVERTTKDLLEEADVIVTLGQARHLLVVEFEPALARGCVLHIAAQGGTRTRHSMSPSVPTRTKAPKVRAERAGGTQAQATFEGP